MSFLNQCNLRFPDNERYDIAFHKTSDEPILKVLGMLLVPIYAIAHQQAEKEGRDPDGVFYVPSVFNEYLQYFTEIVALFRANGAIRRGPILCKTGVTIEGPRGGDGGGLLSHIGFSEWQITPWWWNNFAPAEAKS